MSSAAFAGEHIGKDCTWCAVVARVGSSDAIVVRIFGQELDVLQELAMELKKEMESIPGIIDLHVGFQEPVPHIEVKVDLDRAQAYGLKPGDVRRAAARLVAGEEVGDILHAYRTYDVNVWSTPETRHSLTATGRINLPQRFSSHQRPKTVSCFSESPSPLI